MHIYYNVSAEEILPFRFFLIIYDTNIILSQCPFCGLLLEVVCSQINWFGVVINIVDLALKQSRTDQCYANTRLLGWHVIDQLLP